MSLRNVNLNHLPVLQALLNTGSVAEAARQVGLSQPATSGVLAQLRETLKDPLLIRSGRGMKLTGWAEEMRDEVNAACVQISTIYESSDFDPVGATRQFVIAAPDDLAFNMSEALLETLKQNMPGIRLRIVSVPTDLPVHLDERRIDLAVCGNFNLWPALNHAELFEDELVCAVAPDHPLSQLETVTAADIARYPSITFQSNTLQTDTDLPPTLSPLPVLNDPARLAIGSFTNAALIAAKTRAVARLPKSFLPVLADVAPLREVGPSTTGNTFPVSMFWSKLQDRSRSNVWLRGVVRGCFPVDRHGSA